LAPVPKRKGGITESRKVVTQGLKEGLGEGEGTWGKYATKKEKTRGEFLQVVGSLKTQRRKTEKERTK